MTIHRLLRNTASDPETITTIADAFERACRELGLIDRKDPARDAVARKVIEIAQAGERDGARLRERTVAALKA